MIEKEFKSIDAKSLGDQLSIENADFIQNQDIL